MADHLIGHRSLTDLDPQLQELAVNARRAPKRVFSVHCRINTLSARSACGRPPRQGISMSRTKEAQSVPANDGVRLDDDDDVEAGGPQTIETDPEQPVDPRQQRPGSPVALEHRNLMAKGNEFKLQRGQVLEA